MCAVNVACPAIAISRILQTTLNLAGWAQHVQRYEDPHQRFGSAPLADETLDGRGLVMRSLIMRRLGPKTRSRLLTIPQAQQLRHHAYPTDHSRLTKPFS